MGRKGRSITISLSDEDKARLEELALEYGMRWGDRANISKLIEAIARQTLKIAHNNDWPIERIVLLDRIRGLLVDMGRVQDAVAIAELLRARSELTIPLRQELDTFLERDIHPWRIEIERYIKRERPFQLSYQDPRDQIFHFNIYYAKIVPRGDRQYLDCWCAETDGNKDLPDLEHNRTLRLDRITDAAVTAITPGDRSSQQWRKGLDTLEVEMHLYGGLAFGYSSKRGQDVVVEWLPDAPRTRRIVRSISSSFWFERDILPYGADCEVISPPALRSRIQATVQSMAQRYL